jgi:hypothetical protein
MNPTIISPDGLTRVVATPYGPNHAAWGIELWDHSTNTCLANIATQSSTEAMALSRDGRILAWACLHGAWEYIHVWDVFDRSRPHELCVLESSYDEYQNIAESIRSLSVAPTNEFLLAAISRRELPGVDVWNFQLWDIRHSTLAYQSFGDVMFNNRDLTSIEIALSCEVVALDKGGVRWRHAIGEFLLRSPLCNLLNNLTSAISAEDLWSASGAQLILETKHDYIDGTLDSVKLSQRLREVAGSNRSSLSPSVCAIIDEISVVAGP